MYHTNILFMIMSLYLTSCASPYVLSKYHQDKDKLSCIKAKHQGKDFDKNFGKWFKKYNDTVYKSKDECESTEDYINASKKYEFSRQYVIISTPDSYSSISCKMRYEVTNKNKILSKSFYERYTDCSRSKEFEELKVSEDKKEKNRRAWIAKKNEKERRNKIKEFISRNSKYSKFEQTALDKKISIGMPEDLLLLSWGQPQDINKTVGSWGVNKQYVYGSRQYVYVKNGVISSWQN